MQSRLNEDIIGKLAAQFSTLPDVIRMATDMYVPGDESPAFYKGYVMAVMTIVGMLNEQNISLNYDALVAIAGRAAQLRQGMLAEEQDASWLDQIEAWLQASYKEDRVSSNHH
jgi:thiamine pyrophosphate-dependent acetolactate synthase large subunit-like protein